MRLRVVCTGKEDYMAGIDMTPQPRRFSPTLVRALLELAGTGAVIGVPKPGAPPVALPAPRALVNRCACGQRISDARRYCKECFEIAFGLVIKGEASPTTVQLVLEHSTPDQRAEVIRTAQTRQAVTEVTPA